jgi:pSer/pThr/pTyr-binding forkhead associated (FHA) protein
MENLIRNQAIDTHSNLAAFMVTSERRRNDLFLVPKIADKSQWSLGRAPASDITFDDVTVSASHAVITYENGNWLIEDNVSTNGTKVNGNPAKSTRIKRGDMVTLGTVDMLFMPLGEP